jgi:hypothetical protein
MNPRLRIALIIAALVAAAILVDHYSRCYGRPLTREEAVRRANAQLQNLDKDFVLGAPLPVDVGEQYDPDKKTWIITFRGVNCELSIITDRCHGTDIGGMSEGCKERRSSR